MLGPDLIITRSSEQFAPSSSSDDTKYYYTFLNPPYCITTSVMRPVLYHPLSNYLFGNVHQITCKCSVVPAKKIFLAPDSLPLLFCLTMYSETVLGEAVLAARLLLD